MGLEPSLVVAWSLILIWLKSLIYLIEWPNVELAVRKCHLQKRYQCSDFLIIRILMNITADAMDGIDFTFYLVKTLNKQRILGE